MKIKNNLVVLVALILMSFSCKVVDQKKVQSERFDIKKDLLLGQFDCKTDVDDLHSIAAFATLLAAADFKKVNYHAVAGTYGTQEGLYVPANELFQLAFGDKWTDAHNNIESAVVKVKAIVTATLNNKGDIWIADAGQSDFTAALIKAIQKEIPMLNISERIHVVQHSEWNEKSTSKAALSFVKKTADYHKIADGNFLDNGSPGFHTSEVVNWQDKIKKPKLIDIWNLSIKLSNQYNGKEGRYNNKAIASGGLDFSDLSETCYILGLQEIKDIDEFFNNYSN